MQHSQFLAGSLVSCTLLALVCPALAEPTPPLSFEARLDTELGVASGLTANDLVQRALDTSFDVRARESELLAAAADPDRALLGHLPKLTASASYTRLRTSECQS